MKLSLEGPMNFGSSDPAVVNVPRQFFGFVTFALFQHV